MLTLTIITKNEITNLQRLLPTIQNYQRNNPQCVVSEIVVVDTQSHDGTQKYAESMGAKVFDHPFAGIGKQKQVVTAHASNDWVLNLDADEVPDEAFWASLEDFMKNKSSTVFAAYFVRDTILLKKRLRFGGASRQKQLRVFNRRYFNWNDAYSHERVVALSSHSAIYTLTGRISHYSWTDIASAVTALNRWTNQGAVNASTDSLLYVKINLYLRFFIDFKRRYLFRLGFLDGSRGFIFCFLMAFSQTLKFIKKYEQSIES